MILQYIIYKTTTIPLGLWPPWNITFLRWY